MSTIPNLAEMVEQVPELYEALRERDSAANYVCEILSRNGQTREALHRWIKASKQAKALVSRAIEQYKGDSQ